MDKINFTKDIKNVFASIWRLISDAFRYVVRLIKKIRLSTVKFIVGIVLVIVSYIAITIDVAGGLLMLIDPMQFNKIIYGLLDVNLFAYIVPFEYYTLVVGVLLMEIIFWIAIASVGWCMLGRKTKDLKKKTLVAGSLFIMGLFSFSIGLYYALPEIKIPLKEISEKVDNHHRHHYQEFKEYEHYYYKELYKNR